MKRSIFVHLQEVEVDITCPHSLMSSKDYEIKIEKPVEKHEMHSLSEKTLITQED